MNSLERFRKLERFAELAKDKAGKELHVARDMHQREQQQLDQLHEYYREYQRRFADLGEAGMNSRQLQDYRAFFVQLGQALESQRDNTGRAEARLEQRQQHWLEKQQRRASLAQVVSRVEAEYQRARARKEQKQSDEAAQRSDSQAWS